MNITLEVDKINRFHAIYPTSAGTTNIFFHDLEYIIFPLVMLKNFHVQFDVEKRLISFYSNDTNILEIKEKAFLDSKDNNTDRFYTWLIIFIISGILLILGCIYYFFYYKKKYLNFEKFNKYSKYEDEETILS